MKCKYWLFPLLFLLIAPSITAQVFGGNPSSTRWRTIGNDTFQVIFPSSQLETARKVASMIAWQSRNNNSLGTIVASSPIVLQPEVIYSNGYVGLGPFRSEFYLMPPLDPLSLGSQDWAENLAIHEFRHIQQYNNFNVGLSKTIGKIFGQNGRALANATAVPDWFFEGDAVYNETKLSTQGRGRLPQFMNAFAALDLAGKKYSYEKIRNGSFKDYVPNHYPLGYILVAYGYEHFGADFWQKVTKDAAAYKHLFYPFQSAIEKYCGISFDQYVHNAFAQYQSQISTNTIPDSSLLPDLKKRYQNFQYPIITDSTLFAIKTSYHQVPKFVKIDKETNNYKIVATSAITYDDYFSSNGKSIVYSSWKPDLRWGNRQYSQIRILDINSKQEKVVGQKSKWFQPDISPTGDSLLVVSSDSVQGNELLLLDKDGNVLKRCSGKENELFSAPKFYKNKIVVFVRNDIGYMATRMLDIESGNTDDLIPFSNKLLAYPNIQNDTMFFTASMNGQDALFAYNLDDNKFSKVAESSTGIYGGGVWKGKIVGSEFTADGFRLKSFPSLPYKQNSATDSLTLLYFQNLKDSHVILGKKLDTAWTPSKYKTFNHPFNFHSIQPDWEDPNYSLSLYGENVLNTVESQVSYNYNRNEKYSSIGASTVYGGWYLMPVLSASRTFNRQAVTSQGWAQKWDEWNLGGGFSLPLNFSGGKMYRYLTYQSMLYLNNVQWKGFAKTVYADKTFTYWSSYVSFRSYSQQALQQIYPHLGYSIAMQYRYGISAKAHQYLVNSYVYLPGLFDTHSLVLNGSYQRRDTLGNYSFSNGFPISRGYQLINYPQMWKLGANYHFPISYPDWGFGNIVYLLRIRANAFCDYSQLRSFRYQRNYHFRSTGAEIYMDTKWWNQESLTFGLRYSYMIDHNLTGTGASRWEFILPISIF